MGYFSRTESSINCVIPFRQQRFSFINEQVQYILEFEVLGVLAKAVPSVKCYSFGIMKYEVTFRKKENYCIEPVEVLNC